MLQYKCTKETLNTSTRLTKTRGIFERTSFNTSRKLVSKSSAVKYGTSPEQL